MTAITISFVKGFYTRQSFNMVPLATRLAQALQASDEIEARASGSSKMTLKPKCDQFFTLVVLAGVLYSLYKASR